MWDSRDWHIPKGAMTSSLVWVQHLFLHPSGVSVSAFTVQYDTFKSNHFLFFFFFHGQDAISNAWSAVGVEALGYFCTWGVDHRFFLLPLLVKAYFTSLRNKSVWIYCFFSSFMLKWLSEGRHGWFLCLPLKKLQVSFIILWIQYS